MPYALGKSLISDELAAAAAGACSAAGGAPQYWNATPGGACAAALDSVDDALAGLNLYDTLEDCVGRGDAASPTLPLPTVGRAWPLRATLPPLGSRVPNWAQLGVSVPCMDTSLAEAWVNAPSVRAALHAAPLVHTGPFAMCSDAIEYTHDAGSMLPVHAELLARGVRALIYSGDHDMCVPHTGTEAWTAAMGLPLEDAWRSWRVARQVAGYTVRYEGGLTYATVKGAYLAWLPHVQCADGTRAQARGTPCQATSRRRRSRCSRASSRASRCERAPAALTEHNTRIIVGASRLSKPAEQDAPGARAEPKVHCPRRPRPRRMWGPFGPGPVPPPPLLRQSAASAVGAQPGHRPTRQTRPACSGARLPSTPASAP